MPADIPAPLTTPQKSKPQTIAASPLRANRHKMRQRSTPRTARPPNVRVHPAREELLGQRPALGGQVGVLLHTAEVGTGKLATLAEVVQRKAAALGCAGRDAAPRQGGGGGHGRPQAPHQFDLGRSAACPGKSLWGKGIGGWKGRKESRGGSRVAQERRGGKMETRRAGKGHEGRSRSGGTRKGGLSPAVSGTAN